MNTDIDSFISSQLDSWPECAARHRALEATESRRLTVGSRSFTLLHNPARAISSGADVSAGAIKARPCFLCAGNRPAMQSAIDFRPYEILVNPYPVFPRHLTIPLKAHQPQAIGGRLLDMARLALRLPGYTVFYNGPRCGASAPDHMHFQAVPSSCLPLWQWPDAPDEAPAIQAISASSPDEAAALTAAAIGRLPVQPGHSEPMINLLCRHSGGVTTFVIIPRKAHRPADFGLGESDTFISPASIDMAGAIVCPRLLEFNTLTPRRIADILSQVSFNSLPPASL